MKSLLAEADSYVINQYGEYVVVGSVIKGTYGTATVSRIKLAIPGKRNYATLHYIYENGNFGFSDDYWRTCRVIK